MHHEHRDVFESACGAAHVHLQKASSGDILAMTECSDGRKKIPLDFVVAILTEIEKRASTVSSDIWYVQIAGEDFAETEYRKAVQVGVQEGGEVTLEVEVRECESRREGGWNRLLASRAVLDHLHSLPVRSTAASV